jgi:hypothetical protein
MSISELFRYRNDSFQSDMFSSDIGITDVDVGCRISPTLRSTSMPTYDNKETAEVTEVSELTVRLYLTPSRAVYRKQAASRGCSSI